MEKRKLLIEIDNLIENSNSAEVGIDPIFLCCSIFLDIPIDSFFSDTLIFKQKTFLASVLIRICGINENLIWNLPNRYKVFTLIKEVLEPDYKSFNIVEKDLRDNSVFLKKIRNIALEFSEEYNQFSNKIINLKSLAKFPTFFLKFINHRKYKFIIESFCDTNLYNPDLINKIFEDSACLESENISTRIEVQQKMIKSISSHLAEMKKIDRSRIEEIAIVSLLQKTINILQDNLPEEHKIRIANLLVENVERKYPFNKIDTLFDVKIKIVNNGGGEAQNTIIKICSKHPSLKILSEEINVGEIETQTIIVTKAFCNQPIEEERVLIETELSWNDFEGKRKICTGEICLLKQNSNIDWDKQKNPYSLDAVKGMDDFIGRKEIVKKILSNYDKDTFESSIITGQKRVGKSSIGRVVESILNKRGNYIVIYTSVNDLDNQKPETFINSLGETIYSELKYQFEKLEYKMANAIFEGSLYPLLRILANLRKEIIHRKDEYKIVFIIDEFDEIPIQVINNTDIGNAFFQNIRSLIDKREYTEFLGLILIGGENMRFIHQNTQRFNKFNLHYVDYFDKEEYWSDFIELVTKPAKDVIEYSPELLNMLYELTEGNPFYTNLLCKHLFDYGVSNKISYLTDSHLERIMSEKLVEMGTLHFSHFWLDNILEEDKVKKDNLETQRRKFLIAYAQLKRANKQISEKNLSGMKILEKISIPKTIESFINRNILVSTAKQDYRFKPRFAEKWLIEKGKDELISSFINEEAVQVYIQKEEESYVSDKEIQRFLKDNNLLAYRSRPIEIGHVRDWLDQFDDNQEKRLMFNLLSKLKYYDDFEIRNNIKLIHRSISKKLPPIILTEDDIYKKDKQRKDVILSGFDTLGKSTPLYARIYRQENEIIQKNVVFSSKLKQALNSSNKINSIIFIDDIIASGGTIIKEMKKIDSDIGSILLNNKIKVYITAIVGVDSGINAIKESLSKLPFDIEVYCPNIISENETCNAVESNFYSDNVERDKTIDVIKKHHQKLNLNNENISPFGYNNDGLLVAFNEACPNNTLPLLWKTEEGKWKALLAR